jgi:plastocyanin
MIRIRMTAAVTTALLALAATPVAAADRPTFTVEIRDHRFEPAELVVPAGVRFKLIVRNLDPTPEEFESYELNREKIVAGNSEITVFIGPLEPGTYPYFGEFNMDTAQGTLVAE